jgi:hypothetical protein
MGRGKVVLALLLSTGVLVASAFALRGRATTAAAPAERPSALAMPLGSIALELTLGLKDNAPRTWDGQIGLSEGSLRALEAGNETARIDQGRWQARTSIPEPAKAKAKAKEKAKAKQGAGIAPVRLVATLDAPETATVEVRTEQGAFSFVLGEVALGSPRAFLDGAATVERIPPSLRLTETPDEDDFPAAAVAPDGTVWYASVAYTHGNPVVMDEVARGRFDSLVIKGNGDRIKLRKLVGAEWSASEIDVTDGGLDVWRPSVAVDGRGVVWVVWAEQVGGNWDIYARSYDPKVEALGERIRITNSVGPDFNAEAAGAHDGGVWVAWQGWSGGSFDILLTRIIPDQREAPTVAIVSNSVANDWSPAIATGARGEIWVAWDTYDRGNYDVYARRLADGRLDEPVAVATSPRFEARPSLAIDRQGRLWVAFEDADAEWGKDFGTRYQGRQGVPLYLERTILVRCLEQGRLRAPKAQVVPSVMATHSDDPTRPLGSHPRISFPRLAVDDRGALWMLYRRHPSPQNTEGERWVSFATRFDGASWSPVVALRRSENLLDNRPALAALPRGGLLTVYSSDHRTAGSPSAKANDLYAALLDVGQSPREPELSAIDPDGKGPVVAAIHPDEPAQIRRMRAARIEADGRAYRLLRGDFHRHTELSAHRDWDGPMEDFWRYGLDVAGQDWIGPTDHEYAVNLEYMWYLTQKQIDLYHLGPRFVTLFTYERSLPYPSGHRNVMFSRRGIRALPALEGQALRFGTSEGGAPDIKNLYAYLKAFGGLCASHTTATSMGTDWRDNDPTVEPVVEIFQGHRQNYEEPRAPMAPRDADDSIQGYHPDGFVWNALAKGYRLGFQSSSDHVSTHISYAVVLAEEPSRAGILDAFKRRHCYAAQDNIVLDVRCGEHIMGDALTSKGRPRLDIRVSGTAPIARLDIIRQVGDAQPVYVYDTEPNRAEVSLQWTDEAAEAGKTHLYYVRIAQEDGKLAWASPLWVTYQP